MSLVDSQFNVVKENVCDDARLFSENLCAVRIQGKWGYCNRSGEFSVEPRFASAFEFEEGMAPVSVKDGKTTYWDIVRPSGKRVIEKDILGYIHYGTMMDLFPQGMFRDK